MLLMQLKGVNNEQILCTVQYTVLFSKYIVLETLACLITFIYTGCVETISVCELSLRLRVTVSGTNRKKKVDCKNLEEDLQQRLLDLSQKDS